MNWIKPSFRQMLVLAVNELVGEEKISINRTACGRLWCSVDMDQPEDSILYILGTIIEMWGPPLAAVSEESVTRYLFNPIHYRVRNRAN